MNTIDYIIIISGFMLAMVSNIVWAIYCHNIENSYQEYIKNLNKHWYIQCKDSINAFKITLGDHIDLENN